MRTVQQFAALRATSTKEAFLERLGGGAVLVRLDERGGRLDPAPWAFTSQASARASGTGPRRDDEVDAEALRLALEGETEEGEAGVFTSPDEEETATTLTPPAVVPPARGAASVLVVPADKESGRALSVGRDAENDLVVPEMSVSRKHATLEVSSDGFEVQDLGGANGTRINGRPAPAGGYLLTSGDIVAFGDVECVFLDADAFWERIPSFMD